MATMVDLLKYLDKNSIGYDVVEHPPAYSAHEVATAVRVPEKELAKTLIVRADDRYYMVVLPADHRLNDHALRDLLGARHVHLASEEDLRQLFPDCETGAMPPFGNLYALPVVVDKSLTEDEHIMFNACTHTKAVRMKLQDYLALVKPFVGEFANPRHTVEDL